LLQFVSMTPKLTRFMKLGAEALIFVVILAAVIAYQSRNLLPANAHPVPELIATTLGGDPFDLEVDAAPATLVYFFAPWCKICAASSSNINMLRRMRGEQDLRVVMVALDWQSKEISVPVLLGNSQIASDWNIYAFPTYYVLNSELQVVSRDLGYSTLAGLWWRSL